MNNLDNIISTILNDIRVELSDEFDRNFTRQAFFSHAWERRHSPIRQGKPLLINTGHLRQSVHSRTTNNSITFFSDLPYAATHNEGADIKVTPRMKAYFWHRYYETTGTFGRRKDGSQRRDKRNLRLATEAEFYKFMALKKVGSTVRIPRRQFIGMAPEVETTLRQIITDNLNDYFNHIDLTQNKQ